MELKQDLFIIPVIENEYIIYSPLRRCAFSANTKAVDIIKKYLSGCDLSDTEKETKVWDYLLKLINKKSSIPTDGNINFSSEAVIILSQMCNLSCSYCYARESRTNVILDKEKLQYIIDNILSNSISQNFKFSFLGGGEPTITWDLLEWTINYINIIKNNSQNVSISITTNATALSDEKIDFLCKNNVSLLISYDILPHIQNTQRKHSDPNINSFDLVDIAIKKLTLKNVRYRFRTTITNNCVNLMPEMVQFTLQNYKNIKRLHFEAVMDAENDFSFYNMFLTNFFLARKIGQENGVDVQNSISNSFKRVRNRFCNGEYCITPTGNLIYCHRVSSENEKSFELFNYGNLSYGINEDKLKKVLEFANSKMQECEKCFAKWHCAGGCTAERSYLTEQQQFYKCDFTKKIILELLKEKVFK